jgi:uncharacterized protein YidB (DUF937 family)
MGVFDKLDAGLRDSLGGLARQAMENLQADSLPGLFNEVLAKTDLGDVKGLLGKLQESGLGSQVSSWIGNGSNMPITPDQIREALGNEKVQQIAQTLGLPTDKILNFLSENLPNAVDEMSPHGKLEGAESK